jgi:hypothetical protein
MTDYQNPQTLEDRVTALEQNAEAANKAMTDALADVIETLEELRAILCELPPGCVL